MTLSALLRTVLASWAKHTGCRIRAVTSRPKENRMRIENTPMGRLPSLCANIRYIDYTQRLFYSLIRAAPLAKKTASLIKKETLSMVKV